MPPPPTSPGPAQVPRRRWRRRRGRRLPAERGPGAPAAGDDGRAAAEEARHGDTQDLPHARGRQPSSHGRGRRGGGEDNGGEENNQPQGNLAAQLQPSAQAFQALVRTGGGQSLSSSTRRRDLDYALKLTATSVPEHLQCGICHTIVKSVMLVPWDTAEGRSTCESCIRDGLTKNGFTCPLTGTEGVSPDDLFPNVGLRKTADAFVRDVMAKMDAIEKKIEAEQEEEERKRVAAVAERGRGGGGGGNDFDDGRDGIVSGKRGGKAANKKRKGDDELLFGGDDEFGGDVFDVAADDDDDDDEPEDLDETATATASLAIDDNAKTETTGGDLVDDVPHVVGYHRHTREGCVV